jgi:hypothetical protein
LDQLPLDRLDIRIRLRADEHVVGLVARYAQELARQIEVGEGERRTERDQSEGEAAGDDAPAVELADRTEVQVAVELAIRVLEDHGVGRAKHLAVAPHQVPGAAGPAR